MWTVLISLFLLYPQLGPAAAAPAPSAVRTEKLTQDEQKQLTDARSSVAEAQGKADAADKALAAANDDAAAKAAATDAHAKLDQAKRELQGAQDGVSLAHHANTDCGCYVQSQGREYDRVEFKDDTIVIRHVHEAAPTLH
jgi:hypothetical protein